MKTKRYVADLFQHVYAEIGLRMWSTPKILRATKVFLLWESQRFSEMVYSQNKLTHFVPQTFLGNSLIKTAKLVRWSLWHVAMVLLLLSNLHPSVDHAPWDDNNDLLTVTWVNNENIISVDHQLVYHVDVWNICK